MVQGTGTKRLIEGVRLGVTPPFSGEVYDYAANFDLQKGYATKGHFDVNISKYLIAPMRDLTNPHIRKKLVLKAIQTGGSLGFSDLYVPYIIEHDPGDTLWLFVQGNDFAEQYAAERVMPLYKATPTMKPWMDAAGRFGITKSTMMFPHMSVMIGGLNEGNVHSLSKRYVIIDECWLAEGETAGLMDKAEGRTKAFPQTKKIIYISQGGKRESDWGNQWEECNKQMWAWQCDACKKHQVFEFSAKRPDGSWAGMRWETNEFTRPNGRWNYTEAGKTARLECFHCGHQTNDIPGSRRRLDDTHKYIITNERADASISGHQWPSIAKYDISFSSLVVRYLKAKDQQDEHGYLLPLIQFHQQELAINWSESESADYRRVAHEPYEIHDGWPEEKFRFLTVDCQKDFKEFWYVVRAWADNGESRQLARGRCESWEEVAAVQVEWKVKDQWVFVDCGYEQTKVAEECVKHGHVGLVNGRKVWRCWVALKGVRQETFTHVNPKTKVSEKRIYSVMDWLTPNIGKKGTSYRCPFFAWSNLHIKDILRRHRDGQAAKFLSLPDSSEPNDVWGYTAQMNSEMRVKERDESGRMVSIWKPIGKRPNHWWDDEAEQITAAAIVGIIGTQQEIEPEKPAA